MTPTANGTLKRRRPAQSSSPGTAQSPTPNKRRKASELFSVSKTPVQNGNRTPPTNGTTRSSARVARNGSPTRIIQDSPEADAESRKGANLSARSTKASSQSRSKSSSHGIRRVSDRFARTAGQAPKGGGNGESDSSEDPDSSPILAIPRRTRAHESTNSTAETNGDPQRSPSADDLAPIEIKKRRRSSPTRWIADSVSPTATKRSITQIPRRTPSRPTTDKPLSSTPKASTATASSADAACKSMTSKQTSPGQPMTSTPIQDASSISEQERREQRRKKLQEMLVEDSDDEDEEMEDTPVALSPSAQLREENRIRLEKQAAAAAAARPSPRPQPVVRIPATIAKIPLAPKQMPTIVRRPAPSPRPKATPSSTSKPHYQRPISPDPLAKSVTRPLPKLYTTPSSTTLTTTTPTFHPLKSIILQKLTQHRPIPLTHLDPEYKKVHQLLHATVTAGESNSMLLIGARGSGKTALVDRCVSELAGLEGVGSTGFHVVRLNGFVHTDDKLASREIWRQLGREVAADVGTEEDSEGTGAKSYADTLTMLLALLSPPETETPANPDSRISKSTVFLLEEFDLFATHPRQTLLYNLLDIAQSRKAPIAVLGLTTRIDVVEHLEKRVKSRFSHRYVHVGLMRSLKGFGDVCFATLRVEPGELGVEERMRLDGEVVGEWNREVEALLKSSYFTTTHLAPIYNTTKSVSQLITSLLLPIASLNSPSDLLSTLGQSPSDTQLASLLPPLHPSLHPLSTLSSLATSLLIAACRLDILHSTPLTNFPLVYQEYIDIASKSRLQTSAMSGLNSGVGGVRVFSKEVASREWEVLVGCGLVVAVGGDSGGEAAMVKVDVSLEEVRSYLKGEGLLNGVFEKWCKSF